MSFNIIARESWRALRPNIYQPGPKISKHVFWMNIKFIGCTKKLECMNLVHNTQKFNIFSQKIRDIRYNFVVGGDGNVYEGRGWTTDPLLPKNFGHLSEESLLVGFLGFFSMDTLPEAMKDAGNRLTDYGVHCGHIAPNYEFHDIIVESNPASFKKRLKAMLLSGCYYSVQEFIDDRRKCIKLCT